MSQGEENRHSQNCEGVSTAVDKCDGLTPTLMFDTSPMDALYTEESDSSSHRGKVALRPVPCEMMMRRRRRGWGHFVESCLLLSL